MNDDRSSWSAPVVCRFTDCDEPTVLRVVMATVDQLCAAANIGLALLESLEIPLGEALSALQRFGVVSVEVCVTGGELHVDIRLAEHPEATTFALFDGDAGLVSAFFDIGISDGPETQVELVGDLG